MKELFLVEGEVVEIEDIEDNIAYLAVHPIQTLGGFGSVTRIGYINLDNPKPITKRIINAWGVDRLIVYTNQNHYYQIQDRELYICKGLAIEKAPYTQYTEELFVTTIKRLKRFKNIYEDEIKILESFLTNTGLYEIKGG